MIYNVYYQSSSLNLYLYLEHKPAFGNSDNNLLTVESAKPNLSVPEIVTFSFFLSSSYRSFILFYI